MKPTRRNPQAGMTLMEIMIAIAILVVMMTLTWKTIANTSESKRTFEKYEERNHELRMAMGRLVADLESSYVSHNEDTSQVNRRTMFIAKTSFKFPNLRFSTLNHHPMWADANESEQTVISYITREDPEHAGVIDWVRREQRRESNEIPDGEPSDYDILVHDITSAKLEYFNWKNSEWQDTWDTTTSDGQPFMEPSRVRITIIVKGPDGKDMKLTTQARVWMQEALNFTQSGS